MRHSTGDIGHEFNVIKRLDRGRLGYRATCGAALLMAMAVAARADTLTDSYDSGGLDLRDMAGSIRLEPAADGRIHLDLTWEAPLVVAARRQGGRLVVTASGWPGGGTTVVGAVTNVQRGPGAKSSVVIGGAPETKAAPSPQGLAVSGVIRVPAGTPLAVSGPLRSLSGAASLGGLEADTAGAAEVALTVHGPVTLSHAGAGSLRLTGVEGAVSVTLTGAAAVTLPDCAVTHLAGRLTGPGTLAVGCPVDTADLTVLGGGTVRLPAVRGTLTRTVLGGTVAVGQ
jgi:hypothetical protein